jgi:hypothetical protein
LILLALSAVWVETQTYQSCPVTERQEFEFFNKLLRNWLLGASGLGDLEVRRLRVCSKGSNMDIYLFAFCVLPMCAIIGAAIILIRDHRVRGR